MEGGGGVGWGWLGGVRFVSRMSAVMSYRREMRTFAFTLFQTGANSVNNYILSSWRQCYVSG